MNKEVLYSDLDFAFSTQRYNYSKCLISCLSTSVFLWFCLGLFCFALFLFVSTPGTTQESVNTYFHCGPRDSSLYRTLRVITDRELVVLGDSFTSRSKSERRYRHLRAWSFEPREKHGSLRCWKVEKLISTSPSRNGNRTRAVGETRSSKYTI